MKILKHITFFLLIFCVTPLFAQSPVEYMQSLSTPYQELEGEKWEYLKAMVRGKKAKTVESKRKKLVTGYTEAINQVHKVKPYQKDSILKPAILDYLRLTKRILNEEYAKIVDMEEIAEESYDAMEAYLRAQEEVGKKGDEQYKQFSDAQNLFAQQNNVELIDGTLNERQVKMKNASECLEYQNELFLLFFKAFHQEGYVIQAINKNDLNGIEQSTSTLSQFANEGLEKLADIKSFKGDASLKEATKEILKFYKNEAEKDLIPVTDFMLAKQAFEKAKEKFDSKKPKDRTEADINKINSLGEKYNKGVNDYNNTMNKLNKSKSAAINNFYKAREQFMAKNG